MLSNLRLQLLFSALLILTSVALAQEATLSDASPLLREARTLYRKGSFDQALAKYNEALKVDPRSGEAYAGIVRCYLKQDMVQDADEAVQKGRKAEIRQQDFEVAQGELLFRQGRILEAKSQFDEVIADVPPNALAYLGAARVAEVAAMYAREHEFIARAHQIDPDDPEVQKKWAQTQSIEDLIKFLEAYLAQPTNDDPETRRSMRERLEFLKAYRSGRHGHCRLSADSAAATDAPLIPIMAHGRVTQSVGLQVAINGRDAKLLLDTGASGIVISGKLASQIGLKKISDATVTGIGDKPDSVAHIVSADSVRIGNLEFRDCSIEVVDRLTVVDDGIIGADVFSQFLIEMDFPNSRFRLSELPARPGETPSKALVASGSAEEQAAGLEGKPGESGSTAQASRPATPKYFDRYIAPTMSRYVQAFRFGHMLLIPTTINEGPEKLFLLDSGAFDNTIDAAMARTVAKVHRAPRREVGGINGEVKKVFVADQVVLDFGHLRQTVPDIVAFDMSRISRTTGTEVSGSLGMVMLTMLKVRLDYRDALVDFEYVPRRPRR